MRILVSNDDGYTANGIHALVEALSVQHDVYVVVPNGERSAAGHSLTLHTPIRVDELPPKYGAKRVWTTSGTPGDCIKIGINAILAENEKPDMVISGINHGPNLGTDILYSGTVSCALEGALMNIPSIATSFCGNLTTMDAFRPTAKFVADLLPRLKDFHFPPRVILNVNYPGVDPEDIAGIAITELGGKLFTDDYEKRIDPRGKVYYWMAGEITSAPADAMTDIAAIRNNRISITPVTFEMTKTKIMGDLNSLLCKRESCEWFKSLG